MSPKKCYDSLVDFDIKLLNLTDVAASVEDIKTDLILHLAVPKSKVFYLEEMIMNSDEKPDDVPSIDDIFFISS